MTLVAIQSKTFPGRYLHMDANGITAESAAKSRGSAVNTQTFIGSYETFTLVRNQDGSVSFKSTVFDNAYLSLDGSSVPAGTELPNGGGIVNVQIGERSYEKYRIRKKEIGLGKYDGTVGLESVQFPGRFLRVNGAQNQVNVQGVFSTYEEWEILVVG